MCFSKPISRWKIKVLCKLCCSSAFMLESHQIMKADATWRPCIFRDNEQLNCFLRRFRRMSLPNMNIFAVSLALLGLYNCVRKSVSHFIQKPIRLIQTKYEKHIKSWFFEKVRDSCWDEWHHQVTQAHDATVQAQNTQAIQNIKRASSPFTPKVAREWPLRSVECLKRPAMI